MTTSITDHTKHVPSNLITTSTNYNDNIGKITFCLNFYRFVILIMGLIL